MLDKVLSGFSCPKNPDVEHFLKRNAIELKPLTVRGETVSNTVKRKLLRVSELDEKTDTYTIILREIEAAE